MTAYGTIPEIELKLKKGTVEKIKICTSADCFQAMKLFYNEDTVYLCETFIVLFLNRNNLTIGWLKVSQGGISGTVVDIKLIMATALKMAACGMILSHNHPSGNCFPSEADKDLTRRIKAAAALFDIVVLDHVIVGDLEDSQYLSMADEGLI